MIALDAWRAKARAWLQDQVGTFGYQARKGLSEAEDLAVARRYLAARHGAGFAGINWSPEFGGQGLSGLHKMVFEAEEMQRAMPTGYFGVSLGMPVPIIMQYCADKDWVKERALAAMKGEEIWCQLFSEPSGGSDLAGLRTKAEPEGNGWKLSGQKLWTTWAQHSDYGVIVARSDPTVPKHKGLTYFWLDMKAPGVTVRPVKLADGGHHVNEVFFDDVRLEDSQRIGAVGGGFGVAMATLMIERYSAADTDGFGPSLDAFVDLARECTIGGKPALNDGRIRSVIARNYALRAGLGAITRRAMLMMEAGMEPGPEGALNKLVSVRSRQRLSEMAIDMQGALGLAWDRSLWGKEDWIGSWLSAPTGRLAGGADEMLLNTIAERILGLPQDHRPDKGVPFNQIPA
jgi:alkylation response protein AidB-like acyl-CoA dehydrogenase